MQNVDKFWVLHLSFGTSEVFCVHILSFDPCAVLYCVWTQDMPLWISELDRTKWGLAFYWRFFFIYIFVFGSVCATATVD